MTVLILFQDSVVVVWFYLKDIATLQFVYDINPLKYSMQLPIFRIVTIKVSKNLFVTHY